MNKAAKEEVTKAYKREAGILFILVVVVVVL